MTEQSTVDPGKGVGRSVGTVAIALMVASGLGYVLLTLATVLLGSDSKTFFVYWGVIFGIGAAMNSVEQEISRIVAEATVDGRRAGRSVLQVAVVGLLGALLAGAVLALPPVAHRLYGAEIPLSAVALVGGVAFAAQFAVRGVLVGLNRVRDYGLLLVAEPVIRLLVIGVLLLLGMVNLYWLAVAVAAGSFVWLAFAWATARNLDLTGSGEPWWPLLRRLGYLMLGAGLTASVITGYPSLFQLLASAQEDQALGALYYALTLARVPLLLLSPVQALAVPMAVRMSSSADGRRSLRGLVAKGLAATAGLAVLGAVLGGAIGPWFVRVVKPEFQVSALHVAGLVWSSMMITATLLLGAILVARRETNRVMLVWAIIVGLSALVILTVPVDVVSKAVLGLVIPPTVGVVVAALLVLRVRTD
ncbi:hypothetical protein D5S17_15815 [Pseudonocardiaceae bacterium YIM PH 21723]|nr:hypothetical protein D5S17_15815 [Pseudonocardiaceae bacterium YIM PH 21723]